MSIEIGMKGRRDALVTPDKTAAAIGSGTLPVYATPAMMALVEQAACSCVAGHLEEGISTVGTLLNIAHVSASPVGIKVWAEAELIAAEGRRLTFAVKVFDEKGLIGEGTHERFLVSSEKFMKKCSAKL